MERSGNEITRRRLLQTGAGLGLTAVVGGCASSDPPPPPAAPPVPAGFRGLSGWDGDNHAEALGAFRTGCERKPGRGPLGLDLPPGWDGGCVGRESAKAFFERNFVPLRLDRGEQGLFTGYYEPEILGSRHRHGPFQHPLHAMPRGRRRYSRAEIMAGALDGQGLELFWVADPVEAFFLQIQGSGRIRLAEGGVARVGYAGQNGHPYYAIGRKLVDEGIATPEEISAEGLKDYLRGNALRATRLMNLNPSYVYFRELTDLDPKDGPIGAMGVPLTAGRSLAVDRHVHGLGLPVWVETTVAGRPWHRLMVAQDTGGAIKGPGRGDIFFGSGSEAGRLASSQRAPGRIWTLVPRALAPRLTGRA